MGSAQEQKDLEQFLAKVDNVDSILHGLVSKDPDVQAEAIAKADEQIEAFDLKKKKSATEIAFSHSHINKNAYKDDDSSDTSQTFAHNHTSADVSQEAFLASLEADSKRRAQARKERHMKANAMKEQGNCAFKDNNFEKAINCYTEAMNIAKDLTPLYTNRAAAYLKLNQYENAIHDCDFALRIDEKWIKAHIFKAKALQKMHKYEEAAVEYKLIVQIDQQKEKLMESYLSALEKDKRQHQLISDATASLKNEKMESVGISKLIEKITIQLEDNKIQSNNLMYFVGGFQVLKERLVDEQAKTLFRTEGGFKLFAENSVVGKCLRANLQGKPMAPHSAELVSAVVSLCTRACSKMEESLIALFAIQDMANLFISFFDWPNEQVKFETIIFFHEVSLFIDTRSVVYANIDCLQLSMLLFKPNTNKAIVNTNAAAALFNFCLDKKYHKELKKKLTIEFVELIQSCLLDIGKSNHEAIALRMRYIIHLAENPDTCHFIAHNEAFYDSCIKGLVRCANAFKSGMSKLYGFPEIMQVLRCLLKVHNNEEDCITIVTILGPIILKCKCEDLLCCILHLISLIFELRRKCVENFFTGGGYSLIKQLINLIPKDYQLRTHALKILCSAGQLDAKYLLPLKKLDKNYAALTFILMKNDEVEQINQGHIALLLGALSSLPKGLEPILEVQAEGDVVRRLLVLCRNTTNKQVGANCAIALGKLSVAHTNFLVELRKHDGINILSRLKTEDILN